MALQVRKLQEKGKRPLRESNCEVFLLSSYHIKTFPVSLILTVYLQSSISPVYNTTGMATNWMQHQGSIDQ